jgi:spermidine synthase
LKPAWWKSWLSYVWELPVEQRHSDISGQLEVTLQRGEWKLSTGNAIYSFGKHYTSYAIAFSQLEIESSPVHSVLVLGCGIGSVARLLESHPTLRHITALDIDPVMIQLAQKYWPDKLRDNTVFVVEDAEIWVREAVDFSFDLVIADIFIDDVTPSGFLKPDFLDSLKKLLHQDGLLLFSKINYTQEQQFANKDFEKTFLSVFPKGEVLKAGHNLMMVGRKS